jgi:hypothetical protein
MIKVSMPDAAMLRGYRALEGWSPILKGLSVTGRFRALLPAATLGA